MERDVFYHASLGSEVAKAFRKRMQFIRAAADERDFHTMKSLHYEKLRGNREAAFHASQRPVATRSEC